MTIWRILVLQSICILGSALIAFGQDDPETVKIDSDLVVLNATITTSDGKHVAGLRKEMFTVLEDGVPQKIDFFLTEKTAFAAVILLDSSGSMEERVSLARSATIRFLEGLRDDDVSAIYNFDSQVSMIQDFSGSRDLAERFYDLKANGMTVLNDAIVKASEVLASRPEKRRAIIVLSDGADTMSGTSADKALKAAIGANATIYTVDMSRIDSNGKERIQNQGVLRGFAEKSGGRFVATPGGAALSDAFKAIVQELGFQYTVGYQPSNTVKDGKWREIEIKVARPGVNVRTRKGYNAVRPGKKK